MSQFKVKELNFVASGKKSKIINLDIESSDGSQHCKNMTYICGIEQNDDVMDISQNCNKSSLYDTDTGKIIHNLYDVKDVCLKSNESKQMSSSKKISNNLSFYASHIDGGIVDAIQIDNCAYCLTTPISKGVNLKRVDFNQKNPKDIVDSSYSYAIEGQDLPTVLYGTKTSENMIDNFQIKKNLNGVEYNYILEVPVDDEYIDVEEGDFETNVFQTKNAYDSSYSMNMETDTKIRDCREYCGIGNDGNRPYLKYYDNKDYDGMFNSESNQISTYSMTQITEKHYPFQKVESIISINRFKNDVNHKSNLYSIDILNTGLNNNDEKSLKIKQDIKNSVRDICKMITPANTQLFDVYFSGV